MNPILSKLLALFRNNIQNNEIKKNEKGDIYCSNCKFFPHESHIPGIAAPCRNPNLQEIITYPSSPVSKKITIGIPQCCYRLNKNNDCTGFTQNEE